MAAHPTPAPARSTSHRTIASLLAVTALLAALLVGGSVARPSTAASAATEATAASATGVAAATGLELAAAAVAATASSAATALAGEAAAEATEVAARIEASGVDAGTCATVTYTPATAETPQVAELCLPEEQTSATIIVLVHGGGGMGGSRTDLAAWQAAYAELGYVTLSIDYQLNDPDVDDGVWPEPERDVKAAVQFAHLAGDALGTDTVVIQGHSAGARLAGVILTTSDDASFRNEELWSTASEAVDAMVGFYGYYGGFQFEWDAYYGEGVGTPDAADATEHADEASGAALLITGTADSMVEPEESAALAAALQAGGERGDLVELDGLEHGFDQRDGELTAEGWATLELIDGWLSSGAVAA